MNDEDREQEEMNDEEWVTIEKRAYEQYRQNGLEGLFNAPFEYIGGKTGPDSPPPSIEVFLEQNHKILTIVGVFAGLVVYFSRLTKTPSHSIILGMVGSGLMFGVALVVVLHRSIIALAQSADLRSRAHLVMYLCIIVSVMSIATAMIAFFVQFPTVVLEVVDGIVALVFLFISMLWAVQTNLEYPAPIQFGTRTGSLFQNSVPIGSLLLFFVFSIKVIIPINIYIPVISYYLLWIDTIDSIFLNVLTPVFLIFLTSASIALISILARGVAVFIVRLRNRMPF